MGYHTEGQGHSKEKSLSHVVFDINTKNSNEICSSFHFQTPNSKFITSCGVDGSVFTYSVETGEKVVTMHGAHARSIDVTSVQWMSDTQLLTTGRQDCSVRMFKVPFE